ncbi:MAG: NADH-quinone oxidoreductase subunit NuoF [Capsulimonadaceae bacterium]|nr:NADH-quinone oxidoreductase subunit NuoF [Capsulimonadaceae bacterium]
MSEQPQILFKYRNVENYNNIDVYMKHEGYAAARKALQMEPDAVIEEIKASGLRGRGGAGFPTHIKWNGIPKNWDKPHYLVINADEGEPGTAKDRELMNKMPHLLVEGCIIAARAIRSNRCYIYIRGEYMEPGQSVRKAIQEAYDKGFLGKNIQGSGFDLDIHVHMGAGSYECGEESALMSSLMGERGMPRHKPPSAPLPVISGVWDSPTIVNNVETVATAAPILNMGGAAYGKIGSGRSLGTKLFTVSGHVNKPANYEFVLGTPIREILETAGGPLNGKPLKFFIPGGSSTPLFPATDKFLDLPLDYETMMANGSMLGSGGLMFFDEGVSVPALMTRLMHFYAHESCGKCTPCREGTNWLTKIHDRIMAGGGRHEDIDLLLDICNNIGGRSFCALGDAAAMPIQGALKYFRHEYEALIPDRSLSSRIYAPLPVAAG